MNRKTLIAGSMADVFSQFSLDMQDGLPDEDPVLCSDGEEQVNVSVHYDRGGLWEAL